jgi:hypothetical protein
MSGDSERPWVRLAASAIVGGSAVLAAMLPLYCSRQNTLGTEVEGLRQEIGKLQTALSQKEAEIARAKENTLQLPNRLGAEPALTAEPSHPAEVLQAPPIIQPDRPPQPSLAQSESLPIGTDRLTFRDRDIVFQLEDCKLADSALQCSLLVTNKDADRIFEIRGSRLFDDSGQEFSASKTSIGSSEDGSSFRLPSNVPIKVKVEFERLPARLRRVRFLELSCGVVGPMLWDFFNARFDNVDVR